MSKNKKKRSIGSTLMTFFKVLLILVLIGGLVAGGFSLYLIKNALEDISAIDPSGINKRLIENSVILDSNGNEIEKLQRDGARTLVKYSDMSEHLINAYVSIEDKTFFTHSGFNIIRMFGAVRDTVFKGKRLSGTSTITQQLARNLYLFDIRSDRSLDRKIQEAYYAIQLEKYLTKEQIIEAYLNTIYLGSNSKGVQAASQKYFSKDAIDLNLYESAVLAGIPKSPTKYTPMLVIKNENLTEEDRVINTVNEIYSFVYNSDCEERYKLVLKLMHGNDKITKAELDKGLNVDIIDLLNPSIEKGNEITSYFSDMVESEVIDDLMIKYDYSKEEAINFLYTSGLNIHSTIDFDMQKTLENAYANKNFTEYFGQPTKDSVKKFQIKYNLSVDGAVGPETLGKLIELDMITQDEITSSSLKKGQKKPDVKILKRALNDLGLFSSNDLFPMITVNFDKYGNIITDESSKIILYKKANLINANEELFLTDSDFHFDSNGNLILEKNNKLHFYGHYSNNELDRIQIVLKNSFTYDEENEKNSKNKDGSTNITDLYTYQGRDLLIPDEFKSYDNNRNVVINKEFLNSDNNIFNFKNDKLYIDSDYYIMDTKGTIQPQSSMIIIDYRTGELKAIVGGRNITGQKIYNRALNPRQPGSSVKPFAVYTPAIASKQFTAASVIDDVPAYLAQDSSNEDIRWPTNWYEHYSGYQYDYRGISTLREGIEQSMNVVTAKLANEIGIETCIDSMKNFGISTIIDKGNINDHNLSAVALGGMTEGIKPIELAEAYGTFGNNGVQLETITYTKVYDNKGNLILNNEPQKKKIIDENTNFIIRDIMRTGVSRGIAYKAKIRDNNKGIPVAGKTGTTSNKYDAWFSGITPYYVGVTWFGTDFNMPLDEGSSVSAEFWSYVMKNIHQDLPDRDFSKPSDIVEMRVDTKSGKIPTKLSYLDSRETVKNEFFLPGTRPTEQDDIHIQVEICKESGKIATEYCPTTLVVNSVRTKRLDGPYDPEDNLYTDKKRLDMPIYIKDQDFSVPTEKCDIHGETIGVFDYDTTDLDEFLVFLPSKIAYVVNPFAIKLKSGTDLLLPIRTKIMFTKDVILPDDSVIHSSEIEEIPYYDEALDEYNNKDNENKSEDTETNSDTEPID